MADPFIAPVQSNAPGMSGVGAVINGQDPNYLYSVMQAQRNKMLADAMTQQGVSDINYDHAGAISPWQGLAKMFQAYAGAKGAANSNQQLADIMAQGNQRMAQAYGAPTASPQASAISDALSRGADQQPSAPGADGQLVNQGGVGPTNANAARLGQTLLQPPAQSGTGAGWNTPGQATPANPAGAPWMLVAGAASGDPAAKAMLDQWLKNNAPTDSQKNWGAQGVDPRDLAAGTLAESNAKGKTPEIQNAEYMGKTKQQLLAASLAADAKNAEITRKPGDLFTNPITGATGIPPYLPQGVNANGVNPQTGAVASVTPVAGANSAVAATEGAKLGEGMGSRTNPDGTVSQGRISDLWPQATTQGGVLQQGSGAPTPAQMAIIQKDAAANGITPVVNWQQPAPAPSRTSTGPGPGLVKNVETNIATGDGILKDAASAATTANNFKDGLDKVYQIAVTNPGAFGAGAAGFAKFKSYIANATGLDLNDAKTDQDVVGKITAQLAGGGRTDAELTNKLNSLPGSDKTADAVKELVPILKAQIEHTQARATVLQHAKDAAGGDNSVVQSVATKFDNLASPRLIVSGQNLAKLSNASGANVPGTPAHKALSDYVQMLKSSSIPNAYQRIMELNKMGAF